MFEQVMQGAVSVIRGTAPITDSELPQLFELADGISTSGQPMVVFDFSQVPLINSVGLEGILNLRERFNQRGGSLKLAAANSLVSDIFRATEIDQQFEVYEQVSQAVGSYVR